MRGSMNNLLCTYACTDNVGKCGGSAGYLSVYQISGYFRFKLNIESFKLAMSKILYVSLQGEWSQIYFIYLTTVIPSNSSKWGISNYIG